MLIYFINMMLFKDTDATHADCDVYMFEAQTIVQKLLIFGALICIPVMLLGKPIYIICSRRGGKKSQVNGKTNGDINQGLEMNETSPSGTGSDATIPAGQSPATHHHDEEEEEEPMSEIWVHQAIHTIEYVLSTISHTASYLRLWALSLAHARK